MSDSLLQTKLYVPPVRPGSVPRPRLLQRLNDDLQLAGGFARRLTLVCAPAGFGKTTLVSEWLGSLDLAHAWLSLDGGDNDPARFLAYLVAALQTIDPGLGQAVQAMAQAPQAPPAEALLTSLINDLANAPRPLILVVDDYHVIHTLAIHQQLTFLVEHQPPRMHLVLSTREEPPLPLSRLRARGQMVDVRQADLRFSVDETADFMQRTVGLALAADDVSALRKRTEGWVAGLQLAAISLRGSDDAHQFVQSFTGSHTYILDYLMDEVFRQQSPEDQEFLLKTSILDRLSAPLCDAVTGRDDSRRVLQALKQANVFIVSLDGQRHWYRYHHLFADLLRHRLTLEGTANPATLHLLASRWYADHGLPAEAIDHALAADDWQRAVELILDAKDSLMGRGEVVTLLRWYRALPEEVILADPALCLERCWPLILTEQLDAAEPYLAHAEQVAQETGDGVLMGQLMVCRVHIARARGDNQQAMALSEQALALLPPDADAARCVVAINLGLARWYRGDLAGAGEALLEAERTGKRCGNDYVHVAARIFLARTQVARGRLRRAARTYRRLVDEAGEMPIVALAHYDLGRLSYEWNDLGPALAHIQRGIELSRRGHNAELLASGYGALALLRQAQGDRAAARAAMEQTWHLSQQPGVPPPSRLYSRALRIVLALGQDDVDSAARAAEGAPRLEESGSFPDYLFLMLCRARLFLAQGQQARAAQELAMLEGMASQAGWQRAIVQVRALQALMLPEPDEALAVLADALARAEPEGYVRTFVDAGRPMEALLRRAVAGGGDSDYAAGLLAAFDDGEKEGAPRPVDRAQSALAEPLTDREIDVLTLLTEGRTNREIAQALYVSVNTVKTHLKNVYGKLEVSNRRDAVA
ncbi:MAG: LuxR C-terminal-related transcriptional regulator, partial [Anaerolineae bacterium]